MLHLCLIVPSMAWVRSSTLILIICVGNKRWTQPTCPMNRELAYSSIHRRCSKSAISESHVPAMAPLCPLDLLTRMQNCRCSVCLGLMSHPGWNPVGSVPMEWCRSPGMLILITPWDLQLPVEWGGARDPAQGMPPLYHTLRLAQSSSCFTIRWFYPTHGETERD